MAGTGQRLFGRQVRITVGTTEITGLRMAFDVKRSLSKEPNTAEVTIYNLNAQHRAALQDKGNQLIVEAGYGKELAVLFRGTIRTATSVHQGPDWITKVHSGDGEVEYRQKRVVESFKPGTPIKTVVKTVCQRIGLSAGATEQAIDAATWRGGRTQFTQGMTLTGPAERVLTSLLDGAGLEWSIQDGQLQILPLGTALNADLVHLDKTSGLVGSPEIGEKEKKGKKFHVLKVTSLLNAKICPGRKLSLDALLVKGNYRVDKVQHAGDTHDRPFYSIAECRSL